MKSSNFLKNKEVMGLILIREPYFKWNPLILCGQNLRTWSVFQNLNPKVLEIGLRHGIGDSETLLVSIF